MKQKKKKVKKERNKKFKNMKMKKAKDILVEAPKYIEDHFTASYKVENYSTKSNPFDFIFNKALGQIIK